MVTENQPKMPKNPKSIFRFLAYFSIFWVMKSQQARISKKYLLWPTAHVYAWDIRIQNANISSEIYKFAFPNVDNEDSTSNSNIIFPHFLFH